MAKFADLVKSLAAQCDSEAEAAHQIVGNDPKTGGFQGANEEQFAAIVERVCTNADHLTDAAVREDVRATMKSKPYVYQPEKAEK